MQPSDLNKRKEYINGRDKRLKQVEEELEQDDDYDMYLNNGGLAYLKIMELNHHINNNIW